jgi:putative hydrolase of the HAD superfamily
MGLSGSGVRWRAAGLYLRPAAGGELGPLRGLAFDLGGTLDSDGGSWDVRFRSHWRALGIDATGEAAHAALEAGERAVLDHRGAAELALEPMIALHVEAQLASLGLQDRTLRETLVARFAGETAAALRGRRPLLAALAQRLPLAVVSNGCGNTRLLVEEAGLGDLFRVVVDSSEVGVWKPDPGILEPVLRALAVPAAELALVGDRVDRDAEAARAAGMRAVWVRGAAAPPADDPRLARVDAVIASVEALAPESPA